MIKLVSVSLVLLTVAGCTKPVTKWQQSGVSEAQWTEDRAECHAWSRREAEKAYREVPASSSMSETDNSFRRFMGGYDSKKSQQRFMETCLRRLGYRPSEKGE